MNDKLRARFDPRLGLVALVVLLAIVALPAAPGDLLIRLDRRQPVDVPRSLVSGVVPLQELQHAWIGRAPAAVVSRLRAAGISVEILDEQADGPRHFLAFVPDAEAGALERAGRATRVEPGVYLLSAATDGVREVLPSSVSLARLPVAASLALVFDTPGRARAVPRQAERAGEANPEVARLAGMVSAARLAANVSDLESHQTRYASTANLEAAGTAILEYFRDLGLEAEAERFTFGGDYDTSNIIATIPGRVSPEVVVILCAHYDSTSDRRTTLAPGADDNASGTSAVMEAARVLSSASFDFTIRLIAFSAEEWGLFGSRHHAAGARQRGEQIAAVINLDMIGYVDAEPEDVDLVVNPASEWLVDRFAAAAADYAPIGVLRVVNASMRSSDHAPFWDQGYHALLAIEDVPLRNPYYHRTTDTFDTLNLPFFTTAATASIALTADLAQPSSTPATPSGVTVLMQTSRSFLALGRSVWLSWDAVPGATGYHVYRASTERGAYRRLTNAPITVTRFAERLLTVSRGTELPPASTVFYTVTAVDVQGRESNRSAIARMF